MKKRIIRRTNPWLILAGLCLGAALSARAQFPGGGFFQGGGGQGQARQGATARQYNSAGTVGNAMISVDPETRQLIVIADDETSAQISQVITNLDRPKPQVLIKVVFLEVTHADSLDLGIEGAFVQTNSTAASIAQAFGLSSVSAPTNSYLPNLFGQNTQNFQPVPPGAGMYQILNSDYMVTLRAIAQAGKTEILSRPSVLARNNQPATITVGQSVPLVTSVRYDNFGNAINSYQYTDVGIILRVTPFITSDNQIEMIITPEISTLTDQSVPVSQGVTAPIIAKRSADTVVVTPDGQTVIIGGLMQTIKLHTESKIPLLGDIPLLGNLFKHRVHRDAKTELMIFLTPRIVQSPTELAGLTASERASGKLQKKAFTDAELDAYLDTLPMKAIDSPAPTGTKPRK